MPYPLQLYILVRNEFRRCEFLEISHSFFLVVFSGMKNQLINCIWICSFVNLGKTESMHVCSLLWQSGATVSRVDFGVAPVMSMKCNDVHVHDGISFVQLRAP